MNGHIMEYHRIRSFEQVRVDLVWHHHIDDRFFLFLIFGIGEKFHIYPRIGIYAVYVGDDFFQVGLRNIRRHFDIMARLLQFVVKFAAYGHDLAERRQTVHRAAQLGDDFAQGIVRIVFRADVQYLHVKAARLFIQGQHIGQGLRRMERIVAAVDDRNGGVLHKAMRRFGFLKPAHDAVDVAADIFYLTAQIADGEIAVRPFLIVMTAA